MFKLLIFLLPLIVIANDLKKIKVQLQWKHQFEFAGFYMAEKLGLYNKMGLDVEFLEYDGTFNIVNGLQNEDYDFAIAGSSIVDDWQNGAEIYLLANYFKKSPLALVTRPEIKTPIDLLGKKIMMSEFDLSSAHYRQIFDTFGINPENTTFLKPDFNFDSFDRLGIDAYSVFLTNEPYRLSKKNIDFNILSPNSYGVMFNDVNLITSYKFAKNRPLFIKNFVEATNEGWKYALENIDESVDYILEKYNTQNKTKDELLYEARESIQFIMPKTHEIGSIDLELFDDLSIFFYENGWSKRKKDIHNFYYFNEIKSNLSIDEKNYLANKNMTLNVCIDNNWMPFEKKENGKHMGISAEIMELIAKDLKIRLKLVDTKNWSETLEFAKERKCDILPMTMKTPQRLQYLNFTDSYIESPYVLATSKDRVYVNDIKDVISKDIALVSGYAHTEILKKRYPNKVFTEVSSVSEGLKLLNEGKIYGFLDALITIAYEVQKENYIDIKISGTFNDNWNMAIASRSDEPILNSILQKSLNKITDAQKREIFNKWFQLRVDEKIDYKLLIVIVVFFAISLIMTLYWVKLIHNEKERTKKSLEKISALKDELEEKNKKLEKLSVTDQLTNLYNRRKISDTLAYELKSFHRTKNEFSLLIIDIDYFKSVNDKYGHNIGDFVIVEISKLLQNNIRQTDTIGRWGGEEFIIILPNTNNIQAKNLAEKLRIIVANNYFVEVGTKTISVGVSTSLENDTKDSIIERADSALYKAKNTGRNKVVSI